MTGQPYPAGVYIPGFGPPLNYTPGIRAERLGGNPDINGAQGGKQPANPLPEGQAHAAAASGSWLEGHGYDVSRVR